MGTLDLLFGGGHILFGDYVFMFCLSLFWFRCFIVFLVCFAYRLCFVFSIAYSCKWCLGLVLVYFASHSHVNESSVSCLCV